MPLTAGITIKHNSNISFGMWPNQEILGTIPWQQDLIAPRTIDIAKHLNAHITHYGDANNRRVHKIRLCARSIEGVLDSLEPNTLIITAGDRIDLIVSCALAQQNGVQLAGLLLTGGFPFKKSVRNSLQRCI